MGQLQATASASQGGFRSPRGMGARVEGTVTALVFPEVWDELEGGAWLQCLTL